MGWTYVTEGLVSYYKWADNADDYQGNNNLTLYGTYEYADGKIPDDEQGTKRAVRFYDVPGTWAKSQNNPTGLMSLTAFTVEFWVYMYGFESSSPYISGLVDLGYWGYYPFLIRFGDSGLDKSKLQWAVRTKLFGGAVTKQNGTTFNNTEEWIHVAGTWDSSDRYMYLYRNALLDATPVQSTFFEVEYHQSYNYLWVGNNAGDLSPDRGCNGLIDELRVYDRRLSQEEIEQNYQYYGAPPEDRERINLLSEVNLLEEAESEVLLTQPLSSEITLEHETKSPITTVVELVSEEDSDG